jgi:hypothetical protein
MKRIRLLITLLGLTSMMPLISQVGIGTTQPYPSAELEISSANRGLLIPRLSSEDREAIEDPIDGLTVYDKSVKAYSYYDGSRWLFMNNSGSVPENIVTIPGLEMNLTAKLISQINNTNVTDTAGIVYDSGGSDYNYLNNENYQFTFSLGTGGAGYKFYIEYNIAEKDSLILTDMFSNRTIAVFTNSSGTANLYQFDYNVNVRFKSNNTITAPGFAIYYYKVYELGPQGIPPSVTGPWYYRPDDNSTAGGFHFAPNEERVMGKHSFSFGRGSDATGDYSIAFGNLNLAKGLYSMASGFTSHALATYSRAHGYQVTVTGQGAVGFGQWTKVNGNNAFAFGWNCSTNGPGSFAGGYHASANSSFTFVHGESLEATAPFSKVFGQSSKALGEFSFASGRKSKAVGHYSTSIGFETIARPVMSLVIGRYNDTTAASIDAWIDTDPLFIAGNGAGNHNRSNALTLYKNGNLTIAGTLTQNSDARLKRNIRPITLRLSL